MFFVDGCRFAMLSMCTEPYKLIPSTAIVDRLTSDDDEELSMLQINDNMAEKWSISREECDEFAFNSHDVHPVKRTMK